MLLCSYALLITCFYVHMLRWLYAPMSACFDDQLPTCFCALMLICLYALMITYSNVEMLWWLHAHVHWFSHFWYLHTYAHLNDEMRISLMDKVIVYLHVHSLKCFDDSIAEVIGRLEVCVLGCLNALMLVCYKHHMHVCSHALSINSPHIYLLWL